MDYNLQKNQNAEQTYHSIRNSIVSAQHRLSTAVNSAMVTTYWEIGEQIFKACGENDRAEYGKKLLEYLSEQLTAEFGKGFVLIDLKMGKLTHQDLGQMQMYVNYYTREMMNEGDTQPIGIVLCADKGDSIVKYIHSLKIITRYLHLNTSLIYRQRKN